MRIFLPLALFLVGAGAGVAAGVFLRPASLENEIASDSDDAKELSVTREFSELERSLDREYVKLNNQFVIPIVSEGKVSALVVMTLSVEVVPGFRDAIFAREPKLRDSFLQVMFDHANVGGFRGNFTDNSNLDVLRASLRDVATKDAGEIVTDVLILDIARQDY